MAAGSPVPSRRRWLVAAFAALVLVALGAEVALEGPPWAGSKRILWRGTSVRGHISARFRYFDGRDGRALRAAAGETLTVRYALEPEQGALTLRLLAPGGDTVWQRRASRPTDGDATFTLEREGRYRIEVVGEGSRGGFDVRYRARAPASG